MNKYNIKYAVIGAYACALNGHIRATNDIDILIQDEEQNLENTLNCIAEIFPKLKEKITIADIRENIVLKIIDDLEMDRSIKAWNMSYDDIKEDIHTRKIQGIIIPYLGVDSLIQTKRTLREIDQWDVKVLLEIKKLNEKI